MPLGSGTTELVLPGLDDAELPVVSGPQPGHWIESGPKKRNAQTKFALYKDGQTVCEYIEASTKAGTPKATAMADVCWDMAHNFISVQ